METCIIYGAGEWGRKAYWDLWEDKQILFFVDRCPEKHQGRLYGKMVYLPEILEKYQDVPVIVAVESSSGIEDYLRELGVRDVQQYVPTKRSHLQKMIIYGTGNWGSIAYREFCDRRDIVFFADRDSRKYGQKFQGKTIYPPGILSEYPDVEVLVAVQSSKGISENLRRIGCRNIRQYEPYHATYDTHGVGGIEAEDVPYLPMYDAICEMATERGELPFDPQVSRRLLGTNQYEFDMKRLQGLDNTKFLQGLYMMFFYRLIDERAKEDWSKREKELSLPRQEFRSRLVKGFRNSAEFRQLGDVRFVNNVYD